MHSLRGSALYLIAVALLASICVATPASAASNRTAAAAKTKTATPEKDVEARIKTLHDQLHITSAQEPAFNEVAQVMRENAAHMKELRSRAENEKATAVEELETYASVVDAHADGLRKLAPTFRTLYDSMSPEQKKTADAVFREKAREATKRHQR